MNEQREKNNTKKKIITIIAIIIIIIILLLLRSCNKKPQDSINIGDKDGTSVQQEVIKDNKSEKETESKETKQEETKKDDTIVSDDYLYYVNFLNIDGTVLQRTVYKKGELPSYRGAVPTYSDNVYYYTFLGWDKTISVVNSTQTYTAKYNKTIINSGTKETEDTTHICSHYTIQSDGSWLCSECGTLLDNTDDAYFTVLSNGQPTEIIKLTKTNVSPINGIKKENNNISYTNTSAAQDVVIRTNSYDTKLTINAPLDTVTHYDKAKKVDVDAVDNENCYNELGDVLGNVNLKQGKVVVHDGCKASAVVIDMTAAELATVTTLSADNSQATYVPIILNTTEYAWGVNEHNDLINPEKNNIIYAKKAAEGKETSTDPADMEDYGALVDNVGYPTFKEAVAACGNKQTIRLLKDYKYATSPSYVYTQKANYTIDLNGHTLDFNDSGYGLYLLKGQTVTLNDSEGTGSLKNRQCIIYMFDGSNLIINGGHICGVDKDQASIYGYGSLTINGGVIDTAKKNGYDYYAVMIGNYTNNDTPAKFIMTGGEVNGSLYINGQDEDNNIINISGGTINGSSYIAGNNITTITGGVFTGCTCFYFKAGTINISGGSFTSVRGDGDWQHKDSSCTNTGDAIIFEACGYPAGKPKVNITGGIYKGYKEEGGTESTSGNIFFKNYGILVIDYGGNVADMSDTTVSYRHAVVASNTAEGFVTSNGWIHFTDDNTTLVNP